MKEFILLLLAITFFSCSERNNKTEKKAEIYFNSVKTNKTKLSDFLKKMPKGGDIHHHSSGTPYSEEYIKNAIKDSCYINTSTYQLYINHAKALQKNDNSVVLINTLLEQHPNEKDSIINNWSVRDYIERNKNGHDLFFSTFTKFGPAFDGHESELLSEICKRASNNNISYIETMIDVPNIQDSVSKLVIAEKDKWNSDDRAIELKLNDLYDFFKKNGIDELAEINADSFDSFHNKTTKHGVKLKFQTYVVRIFPNQPKIFGHLLLAFETVSRTENLVGVNFVAPEDHINALKNYKLHMEMFSFLNSKYPKVNISLHAGELVLGKGSVKESDLKFHINDALKIAKATRIGHGVDLVYEDNYQDILDYMKNNNSAIEINLESNEVILETNINNHPVFIYNKNDIPICLSTDDEGVLRTNITNQYILLIKYFPDIKYSKIKEIVFNSIKYSFLNDDEKSIALKELHHKFDVFEKFFQ